MTLNCQEQAAGADLGAAKAAFGWSLFGDSYYNECRDP
jgi:hypothetical protein